MAQEKRLQHYSGIGGQAVLEGVMMKNGEKYAVAVRKDDGSMVVDVDNYQSYATQYHVEKIPFVRGVFNFVDSLVLGMRALNYSASFYDDENLDKEQLQEQGQSKAQEQSKEQKQPQEQKQPKKQEKPEAQKQSQMQVQSQEPEQMQGQPQELEQTQEQKTKKAEKSGNTSDTSENVITGLVMFLSIVIAVGLFVILPTFIAHLFEEKIQNDSLMALIEGGVRILVFILYLLSITLMKDIRRLYCYHGAEHKCINCIEKGRPLTVKNVMRSSRFHKRCGTSFLFYVVFISIILFFFIRVDNIWARMGLRILMVPVIAGISYEVIRLAGRFDNVLVNILSAPGIWIQHITTKEPDADMVRVAIASVEAVYDWKKFLLEKFDLQEEDSWREEVTDNETLQNSDDLKAIAKEAKRLEKAAAKAQKQAEKNGSATHGNLNAAETAHKQPDSSEPEEKEEDYWLDDEE